jgi:hypothetical protein
LPHGNEESMCFKRHRRVAQSRIVSITFFVVVSLLSPARAQTMKFTYDAVGNLIERTTIAGAAPQILRQPRPNVVAPGNSASFVVVVNDTRGVTYQWRLNGVAISGATSDTLFIPSVVSGDAGNYTVAVTNSSGTVTSNSAALLLDSSKLGMRSNNPLRRLGKGAAATYYGTSAALCGQQCSQ